MKILHLPNSFLPTYTGGKEVYTLRLTQSLTQLGTENLVAYHNEDEQFKSYVYKGINVVSLPKISHSNPYISRYTKTASIIPGFEDLLNEFVPDIVHFHDQNDGASLSHLEVVKRKNIKAVCTFHTPGQVCPQHSLLYRGKIICDGRLIEKRCTSCQLQSFFQVSSSVANISSFFKIKLSEPNNKISKLLAHRYMTQQFISSYNEFCELFDKIIVFSSWAKNTYLLNQIPENKLVVIDTGGQESIDFHYKKNTENPLEICFIGRCNPVKGIHLLIRAIKEIDNRIPIKVYFYSSGWNQSEYGKNLLQAIKGDNRFVDPILIENDKLMNTIKYHDICVIPSIWPETGPLTVFDAFGAGLPILGSDSAGIADRVKHEKNGLLFKTNSHSDLKLKLMQIIENRNSINFFKSNIIPNRTFKNVASETLKLYYNLLNK